MSVRRGAVGEWLLFVLSAIGLAVAGAAQPPADSGTDVARHRALRDLRQAITAVPVARLPAAAVVRRRAIDRVWDQLLRLAPGEPLDPEYEGPPRSIVLHIQTADPTILDQQVALIELLPAAVRLRLVLGGAAAERALLARLAASGRPELVEHAERLRVPAGQFSSVWARDFALGDERCQTVPLFLRSGTTELEGSPERPLNEVVDLLATKVTRVLHAPIYFAGGNALVGRSRAGRRLLCLGSNDYLISREAYRDAGMRLTEVQFCGIAGALFGVDEVAVLGPRGADGTPAPQAEALFHLDQAMLFLGDGIAIVHEVLIPARFLPEGELESTWHDALVAFAHRFGLPLELGGVRLGEAVPMPAAPAGEPELWQREVEALRATAADLLEQRDVRHARRDLEGHAAALRVRGLTVTRMPLSAERVAHRQYYLNSLLIPVDGEAPLLIMPSFGHVAPGAITEDEAARHFLEGRGLRVGMVRDMAHIGQGSNHCLVRRG